MMKGANLGINFRLVFVQRRTVLNVIVLVNFDLCFGKANQEDLISSQQIRNPKKNNLRKYSAIRTFTFFEIECKI